MKAPRTMGRDLALGAQLALAAVMSLGLAATTQINFTNTSSSPKTRVIVAAPSQEDLAAEKKTARLNASMNVLDPRDAALYRSIFEAQQKGDWAKADEAMAQLEDKRLIGTCMADRFARKGASAQEVRDWLEAFAAQPEAAGLYLKARKLGLKNLPLPQAADTWSGAGEPDAAPNFTPELLVESAAPHSTTKNWAQAIQKALRKGDPWTARNALLSAQKEGQLVGTFAADAQAVIAESFFRAGERDQAAALAAAAAGANQPLGLWIRGLIAWERGELETAHVLFDRLTVHPSLSDTNRAAAHFWAYRAQSRLGNKAAANEHLKQAAGAPRSFYGLLASQLLGRTPSLAETTAQRPRWNDRHRALLAAHPAGWRALALIQVGQSARAEAELRRLNPLGNSAKQQAMLALADEVPLPALAVQLASLSGEQEGFDPMAYPLLPWKPSGGFAVDRALLFALARHESQFDPTAISTRGARGLMQIMPATASRMLAQDANLSALAEGGGWTDPAFNMALGQKYVQHLASLPQIGNNLMFLLAAYNGGPAKVINWSQGKESVDPLLFLESIPVRETRAYIARVLPHYWAYRLRLGEPTPILKDLASGKWPMAPLAENKSKLHLAQAK